MASATLQNGKAEQIQVFPTLALMHPHPRQNTSITGLSAGHEALLAAPHRFSFNGQERTDEIAGTGNHTTALFWEYDTRLGRRWNLDPVDQISISNYAVNRLNPIWFNDPLGDKFKNPIKGILKGIGNILHGRPWRARHSTNLAPKLKPEPEWASIRKDGGFVLDSYMLQLGNKAARSAKKPDLEWAVRLKTIIESSLIHELDVKKTNQVSEEGVDQKDIHIPDEPIAHQVEMKTIGPLAGGQQFDLFNNNLTMATIKGFAYPPKTVFKVQSSDNLLLSLSRVQPAFSKIYGSSGFNKEGDNSFSEVRIIPSYMFRLKIQITR